MLMESTCQKKFTRLTRFAPPLAEAGTVIVQEQELYYWTNFNSAGIVNCAITWIVLEQGI